MLSIIKRTGRSVTRASAKRAPQKVQSRGLFVLPKLPYNIKKGLAPLISPEQLNIHYNQIHLSYLLRANQLVEPTKYELMPLPDLVRRTGRKLEEAQLHAYASQAWNHNFMWQTMTPIATTPSQFMMESFRVHFNGFAKFKQRVRITHVPIYIFSSFSQYAMALNGSGYTWLVDNQGQWEIMNTYNTQSALALPGVTPLLVLDLWEHAYHGDYEDRRAEYIENWWKVVNWDFVEDQFLKIDRHATFLYE